MAQNERLSSISVSAPPRILISLDLHNYYASAALKFSAPSCGFIRTNDRVYSHTPCNAEDEVTTVEKSRTETSPTAVLALNA